jgi:hypothetical protein
MGVLQVVDVFRVKIGHDAHSRSFRLLDHRRLQEAGGPSDQDGGPAKQARRLAEAILSTAAPRSNES